MTQQELLDEVTELREQLEAAREQAKESEDTLRAIRAGEVDAVVVSGPHGEKIYVLKTAEEPYRQFLETMNEGAATLMANGLIVFANHRFAEILKEPTEQVVGAALQEFVRPDHRRRFQSLLARGLKAAAKEEIQLVAGNSAVVWVALALTPVTLGEKCGCCLLAEDITDRRRAEEARAYLASIVDSTNDAVIGKSLDGTILSWNHSAEKVYGYSAKEAIGHPVSMLCPPGLEDEPLQMLSRIKHGKAVENYETERVRKDGQRIHVAMTLSPIHSRDGSVQGASSVAHDISDRRRAEEELRRANAYNRSLIETSLDPLVTISAKGKITDVNEATLKVTGIERQKLIGTDFSDYFTEPDKARKGYQRVFAEGSVTDYPLTIRNIDGRLTDVFYNASLYRDPAGNVEGVFAAARDITRRKRAEQELEQRAKELARSNADLEQFAYVASHDLQEPLRMIASYTQLLADNYRDKLDQNAHDFIDYVVDGATRMQTLIEDLLTYSRVTTRGKELQRVDSDQAFGRALANLEFAIKEAGAAITKGELPMVRADISQLAQLLQNLLSNAIKFRSEAPPHIHVSATRKDNEWVFSVRDNGIGIDPQYSGRIFVIFQRLHTRDQYPGTGIGLAVCKRIVERHHGRIWLESELGKGTCFYFTLPAVI